MKQAMETAVPEKLTHKERTRARILDEAAKAIRTHGHQGIGVAEVMKRAGLTHGGFYAHFKDRDDFVAAAIDRMFEDSRAMLARHFPSDDPKASLSDMIDDYLSERHIRKLDTGCPIAALNSEASRMPQAARQRFDRGLSSFRRQFSEAIAKLGVEDPDALAASVIAEMVGALALARAIGDQQSAISQLANSRQQLKKRLQLLTQQNPDEKA